MSQFYTSLSKHVLLLYSIGEKVLMFAEVQSVASLIADLGVVSLIPAQPFTFLEIGCDCEIFSRIILLLLMSVTSLSLGIQQRQSVLFNCCLLCLIVENEILLLRISYFKDKRCTFMLL